MIKITTCVLALALDSQQETPLVCDLTPRREMDCCDKRDGGDPSFVRLMISPKPLNLFGPAPPEYKRPAELRCERVGSERRACLVNSVCLQVGTLVFA
jgi:hypothetical protein